MLDLCKICNETILEKKHFWKEHKIKHSDYMEKYYPKIDLLTREQIKFGNKSEESYFLSDFMNKINLKKYLESISKEEGIHYLKGWLMKRKNIKKLEYAPSNFELRTLCYPSIKFFNKFYGKESYENICRELGLKLRFVYSPTIDYVYTNHTILIDSRESKPLTFTSPRKVEKLEVGDYSCTFNPHNIVIERKSLQDFLGTVSSGYERFYKEMERAKENGTYVIILIESKISNLFGFKHLEYLHTEASSEYIMKRARDLLLDFPNIQIVCVDGRDKASEFIENIYNMETDPRTIDFQYEIDMGAI